MPNFAYHAVDPRGRERRGQLKAIDANSARSTLERRQLHVLKVVASNSGATSAKAAPTAWWNAEVGRKTRLNAKQLALFTRQLSTMVRVSPLEESLRTIARQSEQDHVRLIIKKVADGVVEGRRLADAMGAESRSFPPLYRAMVAAGESSGSLDELLERLSQLLERQSAMRAKITAALAYPAVLTLVAIGVVAALMIAVVPKVVAQFDDVGQQLPLLTRIVIGISSGLANNWPLMLAVLVLAFVGLWQALKDERLRLALDRRILKLPMLGRLVRDLHAARLARTLATMIENRVPLVEGLQLTAGTIHNRALRAATKEMVAQIRAGGSLSGAMARAGVFPPLLTYFAASGESSGQVEVMLARSADYLEREFDQFTIAALSLLEPAIIVVMGVIVALIILSILLPILQLQTLVGG